MTFAGEGQILAERELVAGERAVHPDVGPPEVVVRGRSILVEEVERDTVAVGLSRTGDAQVDVLHLARRSEHRVPPVGAVTAGLDQAVRVGILADVYTDRPAKCVDAGSRGRRGKCVGRHGRVVGIAINIGWHRQTRVPVCRFQHLEIIQGVGDQELVVAIGGRGHSSPERRDHPRRARRATLGGFDQDHAVAGARPIDRRGRRVLQHLDRRDVVRVDEVDVGILHRDAVDDVERIIVLERADAADADRAPGARRAVGRHGDAGNSVQPLKNAGRGRALRTLDVDACHRTGNVGAPLLRVAGDHHL